VAGAGTGKRPWAHSTMPPPTLSGASNAAGDLERVDAWRRAATISTMASTAPTSWK